MFHQLYLNTTETQQFQDIHSSIIPNRTKRFETYDILHKTSNFADKDSSIYKKINPILEKAKDILNSLNIKNYDLSKYNMEFHQRNCGFEKKKYQWSTWHKDDYATTSFKVYTILFYIRKDSTVDGGNLDYIIDNTQHKYVVNAGNVVVMRGDVRHKPEATSGFGCRDIIVLFIKRLL